ncbi:MAG: hypothetical protein WCC64_07115 [Aliidongia sp.]
MPRIIPPPHGSARSTRRFCIGWIVGLALSALSFAACAADGASPRLSAEQTARIAHACAVTMGFSTGTVQYADCVASLSNSVASLRPAHGVQDIRPECVDRPGNPGCPSPHPAQP